MAPLGSLVLIVLSTLIVRPVEGVELSVSSKCGFPIWLATTPNSGLDPLPGGSVRVDTGQTHTYQVNNLIMQSL